MTAAWFTSLLMFCVVMSFTPGPNNLMATSSGLTHGVRRTLPLILGVMVGFCGLMLLAALGVAALLLADPRAGIVLKVAGAGYMVWLAVKLWVAAPSADTTSSPPLTAWHGAVLQLVNPKAWMMAVAAVSIYVAPVSPRLVSATVVTTAIEAFSFASMLTWAAFGSRLKSILGNERRVRLVNRVMAALAAATALLILFWT